MEEQKSSRKSALIIVLVLAGVIIVGIVGYNALKTNDSAKSETQTTSADTSASQSETPTLADLNCVIYDEMENAYELTSIADGKPLVMNFWATWCPYCVQEMGDFQDLYNTYGDRVSFALVDAVDGTRETLEAGSTYMYENGFTLPAYYDIYRSAVSNFGVTGLPATVVFDADGNVVYAQAGAIDPAQISALLQDLVG